MTPAADAPTAFQSQGAEKYGAAGLLLSSAGRGWLALQAELRSHGGGGVAWERTHPDSEICVDLHGNGSIVSRQGRDGGNRAISRRDAIWVSPAGSPEGSITLSDPVPRILHIYLPSRHFTADSLGLDLASSGNPPVHGEDGFHDPLLAAIASALVAELERETSAGPLLADTLAASLAARLVQRQLGCRSYPGDGRLDSGAIDRGGLDRGRLRRVLDYIEANLEGDLSLEQLAAVACLSRFHFARAFKAAIGRSPHRHVSARRLEHAKTLLRRDDRSLADIALALNFSCQANFTRAFVAATGQTPGRYRRQP
jgi:AraC family transcriptional regulator